MLRHYGEAVCSVIKEDTSKEVGTEENKCVFMSFYQVLYKILGF